MKFMKRLLILTLISLLWGAPVSLPAEQTPTGRPIGLVGVEIVAGSTAHSNTPSASAPKLSSTKLNPARAEAGSLVEKNPKDLRFVPDPSLPNVLLLGDSISMGYTLPVRNLLKGKANVFRPLKPDGTAINCADTAESLAHLDRWLAVQPKWSVIHFNWGLHDLKHMKKNAPTPTPSADQNDPTLHTVAEYRANLEKIVARLQLTGARLIFATTTPVPAGCNNPFRSPDDPPRYNAAAVEVMNAHGIRVDDLYALIAPRESELQLPRNVHFTAAGSAVLAAQVAQNITSELEGKH